MIESNMKSSLAIKDNSVNTCFLSSIFMKYIYKNEITILCEHGNKII